MKSLLLFAGILIQTLSFNVFGQSGIGFTSSKLRETYPSYPTSMAFGPDNKLYITQQDGTILRLTIQKNGPNDYQVTSSENILVVKNIPNHDDRGQQLALPERQITGILTAGTSTNPILYICSSDPRIGGGGQLGDVDLDTNSGTISKLTKNGSTWSMVHLVQGLPRSEENHAPNGLALDEVNNILYVAQGGNTNAGSPSNCFAFLTEYALSGAVLKIDLNQINNQFGGSYTLPTLDDPTRSNLANGTDVNDPYGGNDGRNQAKLVPGGPVQIYSPGYRNIFDLILTKTPGKSGRMYTIDNGANGGWGGYPVNEGLPTVNSNRIDSEPGSTVPTLNDDKVNNLDNLHHITGPGYYGGHPNPLRANPAGAGLYWYDNATNQGHFELNPTTDWPPYPVSMANPVESDFRNPGVNDGALYTWVYSTNGLAEYTSTAYFNGAMAGNLLAASWGGAIHRIELNAAGTAVTNVSDIFNGFGLEPLDIIAQGDGQQFPGTIWALTYRYGSVTVFEPNSSPALCSGDINNYNLDDDGDGYSNGDETLNGTNPCSAASKPNDYDSDLLSDRYDTDDDNDGVNDVNDKFALDVNNGLNTSIPLDYPFLNGNPGSGLFGVGHTGLMTNYVNNYADNFDPLDPGLIVGGAVGALSVPAQPGDAVTNNQKYAFQFGIPISGSIATFTLRSRLLGTPFFNGASGQQLGTQSQGIYFGTGDQNNYLKLVLHANSGNPGLQILCEQNGVIVNQQMIPVADILSNSQLDLFIEVNSLTGLVKCRYQRIGDANPVDVGQGFTVSGNLINLLQGHTNAVAIGLIASSGNKTSFSASWDYMKIATPPANTPPTVAQVYPNQSIPSNQTSLVIPLNQIFADDGGAANLTFTVPNNTNAALISNTAIVGTQLTFTLSGTTGTGVITLRATDASNTFVQTTFQLTVTAPPANTPPTVAQVYPNQSVPSTQTSLVVPLNQIFADDGGVANLTFTVPNNTNAALISNTAIVGTQLTFTLSGTTGTGVITLRATDASNTFVQTTFQLTVTAPPANTPPTVAQVYPNQSVPSTQTSLVVPLNQIFADDGGVANLTFTVPNNTNAALISNTAIVGTQLTFTLSGTTGTGVITLRATDASNLFVETTFQLQVTSGTPTLTNVIRINSGGPAQTFGSETWVADQYFTGGTTYSTNSAISNTTQDQIYQTERYGNIQYHIPVTGSGTYAVDLHLAEIYFTTSGSRIFNINVENGQFVRNNLDMIQTYGSNMQAIVLRADNLNVTDGMIDIVLTTVVDNAKISGIAVGKYSTPPANTPPTVAQVYPNQSIPSTQTSLVVPLNQIFADDGGVANLTFTVPNNTNAALISNTAIVGTQLTFTLSGTTGTGVITLRATDASNTFVQTTFQLTVTAPPANTPPTVAQVYPNQSVPSTQTSLVVPLNQIFADDGGVANLTFTVPNNTNAALISNTAIVGTQLTFTLSGTTGTGVITLRATDASNTFVQTTFQLTVTAPPANTPPTVAQVYPNQSVPSTQTSLVVPLNQIFADDGGVANLTFTVPNNTNAALISNTAIVGTQLTFTLSGTTGTGVITLRATDASNLFVETTFQLQVTSGTPTLTNVIRINSGGPAQTFGSETWVADQYFTGGTTYSTNSAISNTTQDQIYQTERYGNIQYHIPVTGSGTYAVDLHLAEIYFTTSGSRIFNINVENGQFVRNNLDMIQTYGSNMQAIVLRADNLNVTDGMIDIVLTTVVDNAKISGIAVGKYSTPPANTPPTVAQVYPNQSVPSTQTSLVVPLNQIFADDGGVANLTFTVPNNTNAALISNTAIVGTQLTFTLSGTTGTGVITLRATDASNTFVQTTFQLTVTAPPANTPPTVAQVYPNQSVLSTQTSLVVPLNQIFADDGGVANLTFTVPNNTNAALISNTAIVGTQLTFTLSGTTGTGVITLRATDASNLFVETTFQLQVTSGTPTLTNVIRINSGGPAQTFGSETWVADQYFTGGTTYSTNSAISNTTQDQIYQTERYGNIQYHIPVTGSGTYAVDLHLAEIYFTTSGSRIFNINVENGQFVRNNLDMIQTYGSNMQAIVLRADNLNVTDGMIDIVLTTVVDNAKISGIAVGKYTGGAGARIADASNTPLVTRPPDIILNEGQSWDYQVIASDPAGENLSYTSKNLPASLSLHKGTGVIKGTIEMNAGTFPVTLKVTNRSGLSTEVNFVVTVTDIPYERESFGPRMVLYPNPAEREFSLKLEVKQRDSWQFILIDLTGKQLDLGSFDLGEGVQVLDFDLAPFNVGPGLYFLSVGNRVGKKSIKVALK